MNYYEQNRQIFLEGLQTFLRIPSISTLSEHKPDIRRAAEFVRDEFRAAGLRQAELIEGKGNPLVYAEWTEAPGNAQRPYRTPSTNLSSTSSRRELPSRTSLRAQSTHTSLWPGPSPSRTGIIDFWNTTCPHAGHGTLTPISGTLPPAIGLSVP